MNNKTRALLRTLFGVIMGLVGITLALVSNGLADPVGLLGRSLGLSLIIASVVTVFQEVVIAPLGKDELKGHIDRISVETKEHFDRVFGLLRGPGIYMLSSERRGNLRYYKWLLERSPQQIFFAGHSILHRIQADFTSQGLLSVDEALSQKVAEGSKVSILFLDPTWDLLDRIASDQGQEPVRLKTDLATTLGICKKLWQRLENERFPGEIEIHTSTALNQYAVHRVCCKERNEDEILVGFYFAGRLGTKTPLFVVENEQIQEFFMEHFNTVFERSKPLLVYSQFLKRFDSVYYRACQDSLSKSIDEQVLQELCP